MVADSIRKHSRHIADELINYAISVEKLFAEKMANTSPKGLGTLCLWAFQMVRCCFITSPYPPPETPPPIITRHLRAIVGGHASQRDTCHFCASYELLRRWERLRVGELAREWRRLLRCLLCAVATLGSVASYTATYALL